MPPLAQAVHGISDRDLADAPPAAAVLPEFLAFLGDAACTWLLAHNARFDGGFLVHELRRIGLSWPGHALLDTLALARKRLPTASNHRLNTVASMLNLAADATHRALADSLRVKGLWLALSPGAEPFEHWTVDPVRQPRQAPVVLKGWKGMADAIARGARVRIRYQGGRQSNAAREITPVGFSHSHGFSYVIALCHFDGFEKTFRLDRIVKYEVIEV
jgi:DNA polymerase III epsilon subunit-like protein